MVYQVNIMKFRLTLQIKLIFTTALVVILSFLVFSYLNTKRQRDFLQSTFRDFGINIAQVLEANIKTREELEDVRRLQLTITKVIYLNPLINSLSINLPIEGKLKVVASNDSSLIGKEASLENSYSYRDGEIRITQIKEREGTETLRVITPIRLGGEIMGTYEIKLTLGPLKETISKIQRQFLLMAAFSIIFIIFSLSFLIRLTVVNPVKKLQRGMREVGAGNLDFRIKTKREDEFGDLILGFNQMADELQKNYQQLKEIQRSLEEKVRERTQQLEEAKAVLEIKVRARTRELMELTASLEEKVKARTKDLQESQKELQRKVEELEKFQRLVVGRELKMREMKKKIKELEKELEKKSQKQ